MKIMSPIYIVPTQHGHIQHGATLLIEFTYRLLSLEGQHKQGMVVLMEFPFSLACPQFVIHKHVSEDHLMRLKQPSPRNNLQVLLLFSLEKNAV